MRKDAKNRATARRIASEKKTREKWTDSGWERGGGGGGQRSQFGPQFKASVDSL